MEDWEYRELIDAVYETYTEFLDRNKPPKLACVRAYAEYDHLANLEGIIVDVVIGAIIIEQGEGTEASISGIRKDLEAFDIMCAKNELTEEEQGDLQRRIQAVLSGLKTITVDYSNRV